MLYKNKPSRKEIYRLWWEYLRRSDFARNFQAWAKEKRFNPRKELKFNWDLFPEKCQTTLTKNGKAVAKRALYRYFWELILSTGDEGSFEKWWDSFRKQIDRSSSPDWVSVDAYLNWIDDDFDRVISVFKKLKKREPSLEEFRERFIDDLLLNPRFLVSVHITNGESIEALGKKFMNLLRKIRIDNPSFKVWYQWQVRELYPTKPFRFNNVRRYLEVYKLRKEQNKKWSEILHILYPEIERDISDESLSSRQADRIMKRKDSLERALHIDLSNATKIIKNIEKGTFPGKY